MAEEKYCKPFTTLFMLISVDGKISTGDTDVLDVDKDFPEIKGIKEGLWQYYAIEQTTDLFSLNSGKVLAKIGINSPQISVEKLPVSFLLIDNKPHLNDMGIENLLKKSRRLFIITTNKKHPAFRKKGEKKLEIVFYKDSIDFFDLFKKLKKDFKIERLTIQTGATLNAVFLRNNLIDRLSLVVAPALIGGEKTPSLIGGKSLSSPSELDKIKPLRLLEVKRLENSYLHLIYEVIK